MALDSVLPKGGLLCPCSFILRRHAFLGFLAFGSSTFLPMLLDFGKEVGGVQWLSTFSIQGREILGPTFTPKFSDPRFFQDKRGE